MTSDCSLELHRTRARCALAGWGSVGAVYGLTALLEHQGTPLPMTAWDRMVRFNPTGVWLYLSFFLLVPAAFWYSPLERLRWLTRSAQGCAIVSGFFFLLFPTTLVYPAAEGSSWSAAVLRLVTSVDTAQNCLPSLHAALTGLSVTALATGRNKIRTACIAIWGIAILYGILQTHRHAFLDTAAGLALAFASGSAARAFTGSRHSHAPA